MSVNYELLEQQLEALKGTVKLLERLLQDRDGANMTEAFGAPYESNVMNDPHNEDAPIKRRPPMKGETKAYLKNYLGDLQYWCGIDLESVNHYTNGTPEIESIEELREYTTRLTFLMENEQ